MNEQEIQRQSNLKDTIKLQKQNIKILKEQSALYLTEIKEKRIQINQVNKQLQDFTKKHNEEIKALNIKHQNELKELTPIANNGDNKEIEETTKAVKTILGVLLLLPWIIIILMLIF